MSTECLTCPDGRVPGRLYGQCEQCVADGERDARRREQDALRREQALDAIAVLDAVIERDKHMVGTFEWADRAQQAAAMVEAYRARWSR